MNAVAAPGHETLSGREQIALLQIEFGAPLDRDTRGAVERLKKLRLIEETDAGYVLARPCEARG